MSLRRNLALSITPMSGFAAIGCGWGAFSATIPDVILALGMDKAELGRALLFSASAAVVAMIVAPWLMARFGTGRPLIVPTILAMGLVFVLPGQATGFWTLGLALLLIGSFAGLLDVTINARLSAIEARENLPLMSLNHGMFSLVYGCSALSVGLARELGASPAQIFTAVGVAVALFGLLPILDRQHVPRPIAPNPLEPAPALRLPLVVYVLGFLVTIAFFAENATEVWSALHIEQTLGGRAAEGALGPALLGFTMALGRFSGQALSERFGVRPLMTAAALLAATGGFCAAFAPAPGVAYIGFAALGLGVACLAPLTFSLGGRYLSDAQRDLGIARMAVIGYAGFFLGPPLLGLLAQAMGLRAAFAAVAIGLLVFPILLRLLSPPPASPDSLAQQPVRTS